MPRYVRLTPMDEDNFKTVHINCDAIEKIFDTEGGAHITFLSGYGYIDVMESAEYVKRMTEEET